MESKCPLLSICIPTYNRSYILKYVLEKYVSDSEFDDDIEIVISDNTSTDDTEQICMFYVEKYTNIRYYRNKENVRDANFLMVLDYAHGEYLKLLNDWSFIIGDSLRFVKEKLRENQKSRFPIFLPIIIFIQKRKLKLLNVTI